MMFIDCYRTASAAAARRPGAACPRRVQRSRSLPLSRLSSPCPGALAPAGPTAGKRSPAVEEGVLRQAEAEAAGQHQ